MRAIETSYAGCRFRSRLEARWAVFFDAANIEWQYEVQGFTSYRGTDYLPDFYLPRSDTWVEVKGQVQMTDIHRTFETVDWEGLPARSHQPYDALAASTSGLLLLGDVPDPRAPYGTSHTLLRCEKGVAPYVCWFSGTAEHVDLVVGDSGPVEPRWSNVWDTTMGQPDGYPTMQQVATMLAPWKHYVPGVPPSPKVSAAYVRARRARFEHGDRP